MTVTVNMAHQPGMYFDFRVLDVFYFNYASIVTPRPDEVHNTCNCKGAHGPQVPL